MSDDPFPSSDSGDEPAAQQADSGEQDLPVQADDDIGELDLPPDRLAINPRSPHFDEQRLSRGVGIRFKGVERHNVEEYCISEGWVRVQAGKTMDRKGQPLTLKLSGPVEAWYKDLGDDAPVAKAG